MDDVIFNEPPSTTRQLELELDRNLAVADILLTVLERRLRDPRDRIEMHLARTHIGRAMAIGKALRHHAQQS